MTKREPHVLRELQVGMTRNLGGIETYLIEQFRHLDKTKIDYDFVNITGEYSICYEDEILASGSKIFKVVSRHKNPILHYWQWFNKLLQNKGVYDVIVLNTNSLEYVFPLVLGKIFSIPVRVIHSHNSDYENRQGLLRKMLVKCNTILMNLCTTNRFACSKSTGIWMFKNHNFHVINNAIDSDKFIFNTNTRNNIRLKLDIPLNTKVVIHIGSFSYQKNHDFLIDVFNEFQKKCPECLLLLVGKNDESTPYLDNIKYKIGEYGISDKVRFLGMREDVPKLMQAADICLMPSLFEGFGIVAIEAQAASLPIIVSDRFPDEIMISDYIRVVSLEENAEYWVSNIVKFIQKKRTNNRKVIENSGYEINKEIGRLKKLFEQEKRKEECSSE